MPELKSEKKKGLYKAGILSSLFVFFLFFLYPFVFNLSFKFMGNESTKVVDFILTTFFLKIVLYFLRIIAGYLIIGFSFGLLLTVAYKGLFRSFGKDISPKTLFILNFFTTILFVFLYFIRDLIRFPQMYSKTVYSKSEMASNFQKYLTDNIPLAVPYTIIIVLVSFFAFFIIFDFFKEKKYKIIFDLLAKLKRGVYISFFLLMLLSSSIMFIFWVTKEPPNKGPNIIIIASDAVRPDHLGISGYFRRDISPNIDNLAKNGIFFANNHVEVPRTLPSWATILSGYFSSTTGLRHMFPTSGDRNRNLITLPKILKKYGYKSAVVADYAGDNFNRSDLGFDIYDSPSFYFDIIIEQVTTEMQTFLLPFITNNFGRIVYPVLNEMAQFSDAEILTDKVIKNLDILKDSEKFFLVIFYGATHFPYSPPYPYYNLYADKNYNGPFKYQKENEIELDGAGDHKPKTLSDEDKKQTVVLYDSCIKSVDDNVGRLIRHLEYNKMLDNTIILFTSDHGENLYDGDLGMGHGEHFRGEFATKTPLIIYNKKMIPSNVRIDKVTRSVDITPTLLDLLGIKTVYKFEGVSLKSYIKDKNADLGLFSFGETGIIFSEKGNEFFQKDDQRIKYPDITGLSDIDLNYKNEVVLNDKWKDLIYISKHRYIQDEKYRLIYIPTRDGVKYELYDVKNDKFAQHNLLKEKPEEVKDDFKKLKSDLFNWVTRNNDEIITENEYIIPKFKY